MDLDVLFLSRFQFALTIMFHYLFPPLSIGLGVIMVITEGMFLKTKNRQYEIMARFWTKIFAVVFALGVATGIVMEFEFGTNWATYSRYVGDVFGSPLAAEGVFAFFLESGFLAVLVFGWDRVGPKMHFFSTVMVSLGSMFSAVWIVVANSWQQTPTGYHIVGEGMMARAEITDFWAMVFNPSSVDRLTHTLIGAFILGGFFVMSITAWYILHRRHVEVSKQSFTIALVVATIASLAALISGHHQANTVSVTQPAKLAAFEGHFHTGPADLWLFGIPDAEAKKVHMGIAIPGGLSFLVHGDFDAAVTGLDAFPEDEHPPLQIPFQAYHIMIALGMYFIGITLLAAYFRWRGTLFDKRWLLWVFVFSIIGPYIANQAGWVAAEVGRQPWIVYGLLRTSDALSKAVSAEEVLTSIILFTIIYLFLFAIWLYIMNEKIKHGPEDSTEPVAASGGLFDAVGQRAGTGGASLTNPHDDGKEG
jgi:cytochrome d ubiquinol oxidase subunit I